MTELFCFSDFRNCFSCKVCFGWFDRDKGTAMGRGKRSILTLLTFWLAQSSVVFCLGKYDSVFWRNINDSNLSLRKCSDQNSCAWTTFEIRYSAVLLLYSDNWPLLTYIYDWIFVLCKLAISALSLHGYALNHFWQQNRAIKQSSFSLYFRSFYKISCINSRLFPKAFLIWACQQFVKGFAVGLQNWKILTIKFKVAARSIRWFSVQQ